MPEELLICHCAPTLAGIKTGSLFSCPCTGAYYCLWAGGRSIEQLAVAK